MEQEWKWHHDVIGTTSTMQRDGGRTPGQRMILLARTPWPDRAVVTTAATRPGAGRHPPGVFPDQGTLPANPM